MCPQFCSKVLVDSQVYEEVTERIDIHVVREAEVAADWSSKVCDVHDWREGDDEDQEETKSDLHRLHVAGMILCAVPNKTNMFIQVHVRVHIHVRVCMITGTSIIFT